MSETNEPAPEELRSIDDLNSGKAFAAGVISTCLMGLVPILNQICCLHFCIGAFITVWVYAASNQVTINAGHGIWVSFKAVWVGTLFAVAIYSGYILAQSGGDLTGWKEQIFEQMAAQGRDEPEVIDMINTIVPDEPGAVWIILASMVVMFGAAVSSLFGAAIGGTLATAIFKKGPLAQ